MALINERKQVIPKDAAVVPPTNEVMKEFHDSDPDLAFAVDTIVGALRQDMLPTAAQERIFAAFNPALRRLLIAQEAGLEATILTTLKDNLRLVDSVLRRTFNDDGSVKSIGSDDIGMNPKDVMNLSLKVAQMMIKDLPKIYSVDRYQRTEAAVFATIQKHLTREQQQTFIAELERSSEKL